jgi:hypothetical protein
MSDWLLAGQAVAIGVATGTLCYALWLPGEYAKGRLAMRTVRELDAADPGWRVKDPEFAAQLDHLTEEAAGR